ncbi:MAG: SprB repeat-containing protein, partial [Bacteroidota bacterium]
MRVLWFTLLCFFAAFDLAAQCEEFSVSGEVTHITCNGEADGSIDLTVSGSPPFIYSWSNGAIFEDLTNLPAGIYEVVVRDINNCTLTASFTVAEPDPIEIELVELIEPECGGEPGYIEVIATGGTDEFTYNWWNGDSSVSTSIPEIGFVNDQYVTVTDAVNCSATQWFNVGYANLDVSIVGGPIHCGEDEATLQALPQGEYTYEWRNQQGHISNEPSITTSEPGIYWVWVRDTSVTPACYDSAFVYELIEVDYGPPAEIEIFPIDCQTANVVATFPTTGQYEVFLRLDGNVILETFVEGDQVEFLQLEINEYDIFAVNLATGCESETPFSIPALNELEITSVIVENTSCFGECDGAIFIEVAGGVAPLFYQWANGETSQNIDNLCAGWYGLTVVDGNGCTGESNFLVEEPSLIVAEVVEFVPPSCGQSNGFLQLVASGGTPPYIYSLDGIDSESGIFSGLPVGDYSFTVTDANG